jgi:Leishmanolysin
MRTDCPTMNRPSSSRKRSLALIGVPYLLLLSSEASPLRQHALKPPQRAVLYDNRRSESIMSFSKFWIPSYHRPSRHSTESSRVPASELHHRRRIALSSDGDMMASEDLYSHLIVDALHEDVDEVFKELRRRQRQRGVLSEPAASSAPKKSATFSFAWLSGGGNEPQRQPSSQRDEQDSPWHWRRLLRRTSEKSDWFGSSTMPSLPGFVNVDVGSEKQEQKEYNITTGTESEYNGDASSGTNTSAGNATSTDGTNPTGSSDATTVIFTDSERLNQTNSSTNSSVGDFRPIRIRAYLSEVDGAGQFLSDPQHSMLLQLMLRPALLSWSAALRVDPVVGNLTVDRQQLVDGATCGPGKDSGLPSARVPESHMTVGVAHADMIVYLNIAFVDRTNNGTGTETAADILENEIPNRAVLSQTNDSLQDGAPLNSRPLEAWTDASILRNSSNASKRPTCSGSYLAASAICSTDQYDRPSAGILHICIDEDFFNETSLRRNIITLRHELAVRIMLSLMFFQSLTPPETHA